MQSPQDPPLTPPPTTALLRPPEWLGIAVCLLAVLLLCWLQIIVFRDRIFPLSVMLPLLLALWVRSSLCLYVMALLLSLGTGVKIFSVMPDKAALATFDWFWLMSELVNIWLPAVVIHKLLKARTRLEAKRTALQTLNTDLARTNERLVTREEEISSQNEELQSQTEELEQQSEELRQQAEELEQQTAECQELNRELMRREKGLETLLHSGRWMRGDMSEAYVMSGVCQAALQILDEASAAEVVAVENGEYEVRGDCGFGLLGRMDDPDSASTLPFASLVVESQRTAGLPDLRQRPDLRLPVLRAGRPLASAIGAPVWYEGKVVAVLCIYASEPRQWTEHEFSVVSWLSSQAAMALQSTRIQLELDARRHEAESAALKKSQFLAAVSHDVRTPANAISLLAELLQRAGSDPRQAHRIPELAKNLWTNARSLVDLVSDVLDLTRLDSGVADLQVTEFHLHEVVEAELFQYTSAAADKGLTLGRTLPEEPLKLVTDRTKLKRIIANLIGNAIKFTETGSVQVNCTAGVDGVWIAVTDTGVGIPGESVDKVFDEFFQLRNPERNRDKGAGLGLAICRRLAHLLGCKLTIASEHGKGSTFTIFVPAELVAKPVLDGAALPADTTSGPRLGGLRILVVEDNEVARRSVEELLAGEGAEVATACDGRAALDVLEHGEFEVLLLDLNLPDMDGSVILAKLAERPRMPMRTIVITGDARPERSQQVRDLGADEVLAKPVSLARLRAALGDGRPSGEGG